MACRKLTAKADDDWIVIKEEAVVVGGWYVSYLHAYCVLPRVFQTPEPYSNCSANVMATARSIRYRFSLLMPVLTDDRGVIVASRYGTLQAGGDAVGGKGDRKIHMIRPDLSYVIVTRQSHGTRERVVEPCPSEAKDAKRKVERTGGTPDISHSAGCV